MDLEIWDQNPSFYKSTPRLQWAWDSTSSGAFQKCKRYYYYSILCGLQASGENVHLKFGLIYHAALERYDHALAEGKSKTEALHIAVRYALCETWDNERNRPWMSLDSNKNRYNLIRTIIWYCLKWENDPIPTVILSNGKPAVELSFRMELDLSPTTESEVYYLCGHLDKVGEMAGQKYIMDKKTTASQLDEYYFSQFTPHNQFSLYPFAGKVVYSLPIHGIICDAAQVGATFSRFSRQPIGRTQEQLDEWHTGFQLMLREAEVCAKINYYPQNPHACGWGRNKCQFHGICSKTPSVRKDWLNLGFEQRMWSPLDIRGEV